jgi:dCTP diphosphatase
VSDQTTSVEELKTTVAKFVAARDWERYHGPKNLAMSISIEAAEIMEHFQWLTVEEADESMADPKVREEVEEELADVLIYCFSFANQTGIDVSEVIRKKLERNEGRFPVEKVKGFGVEKDSEMGK